MMGLLLVIILVALLLLRQNLIVILTSAAVFCYLVWGEGDARYVLLDAWYTTDKEALLSIPLFILAGNIMSSGSIAERLINIMRVLTAPIPGGLSIAIVLSCAVFAAISGSAIVTLIAVGGIMYPALIAQGYDKKFSLGSLCAAGTLGIIIPPSIPLILYGVMTETNIADLFKAGIGPAFVLTALMGGYALFKNWHMGTEKFDTRGLITAVRRGILSLFMPILILGGFIRASSPRLNLQLLRSFTQSWWKSLFIGRWA